jgi:phosphopantothenoylcysteine decarboxylase/phosphopantothenate--cysteine ligase
MVDLELIVHGVEAIIAGQQALASKRVLITVGGTRESIDNMRVLTNLSTGKLGWYLAHTAALFGAKVGVISTVPALMDNPHLEFVELVNSVAEMQNALYHRILATDTLIMAAAVSDFTVARQDSKMKREGDTTLELIKTPDLLKSLEPVKGDRQFIGFCLEDNDLLVSAKRKLQAKNLDYIVANSSQAVGADMRSIHILSRFTDDVVSLNSAGLADITRTLLALGL